MNFFLPKHWETLKPVEERFFENIVSFVIKHVNIMSEDISDFLRQLIESEFEKKREYNKKDYKAVMDKLGEILKSNFFYEVYGILYLQNGMMVIYPERWFGKGTLAYNIYEEAKVEINSSSYTKPPPDSSVCRDQQNNEERNKDAEVVSLKLESPFEATYIINGVLYKLYKLSKEGEKEKNERLKKVFLAKALVVLRNNRSLALKTIHPCELLFGYVREEWYNVIYGDAKETSAGTPVIDKNLVNISDGFLTDLFKGMSDEEFKESVFFLVLLHCRKENLFSLGQIPKLVDLIYEEYVRRVAENSQLLYLAWVFAASGCLCHDKQKEKYFIKQILCRDSEKFLYREETQKALNRVSDDFRIWKEECVSLEAFLDRIREVRKRITKRGKKHLGNKMEIKKTERTGSSIARELEPFPVMDKHSHSNEAK